MAKLVLEESSSGPRRAVIETAESLFSVGGLSAISMRAIANVLGVTAMMPYRYFPSKDHLITEMRLRAFQRFTQALKAGVMRETSAEKRVVGLCHAYVDFALSYPNDYRLMFDHWEFEDGAQVLKDFGSSIRREENSWRVNEQVVREFLNDLDSNANPVIGAHVLWSTLHGLTSLHLGGKLVWSKSIGELVEPTIDSAISALRAL